MERCFEVQKGEIGLDHFEGRRYQGLKRHMILNCVSYLFLSRIRREYGKKTGVDGVPGAYGAGGFDSKLVVEPAPREEASEPDRPRTAEDASANCGSSQEPHQGDTTKTSRVRHQAQRSSTLHVGKDLAL